LGRLSYTKLIAQNIMTRREEKGYNDLYTDKQIESILKLLGNDKEVA